MSGAGAPEAPAARAGRRAGARPLRVRSAWLPWIGLLLSLGLSFAAWLVVRRAEQRRVRDRFEAEVDIAVERISRRMSALAQILRAAGEFVSLRPEGATRAEWRQFVEALELERLNPGVQALAFSEWVPAEALDGHVRRLRAEGFPGYEIRPGGPLPPEGGFSSIVYIEPFDERNQRAFSRDMYAEATRRSAMARARDTGIVSLSGRVTLYQETATKVQAGTLLYAPAYRRGAPTGTVAERQAALLGWPYMAFRMENLVRGMVGDTDRYLSLTLHDGEGEGPETLLYESPEAAAGTDGGLASVRRLEVAGRLWTLRAAPRPGFLASLGGRSAQAVLGLSVVTSLALLALFLALARAERRALAAADEQREKLQLILDSTAEAIYGLDDEGRCTFCNAACVRLLGFERPEDLLGRDLHRLVHRAPEADGAPGERDGALQRAAREGQAAHLESETLRRADGSTFTAEVWAYPQSRSGRFVGSVVTFVDATRRHRAEEERQKAAADLRRALEDAGRLNALLKEETARANELAVEADAANAAKSAFLARMSHEIRTPMNSVLGFAQLLLGDPELSRTQRERLEAIQRSGGHLLTLIDDVLVMSRIEAGRVTLSPGEVDLRRLLDDVELMFRLRMERKGLSFAVSCSPRVPRHVVADEQKVRQVLINLLGNAARLTAKGRVDVRVRAEPAGPGRVLLALEVEDTGPGIAKDDLPRLFRHFEQTRAGEKAAGGTGLGLAISLGFVRLMGGDIAVRSEPGVGTVFTVTLPVEVVEAAAEDGAAGELRVRGLPEGASAPLVLVVDDVEDNRRILADMLRRVGLEVETAVDGEDALDRFARRRPDLVLMDLQMPRLDGCGAIRAIRRAPQGATLPVIAVSASSFEEDRREARAAGADEFISKPFRESELFRKAGRLLGIAWACEKRVEAPPPSRAFVRVALPASLRESLVAAITSADPDRIEALLDELGGKDPEAAAALRELAESYEYERLLALLGAGGR